MGEQKRTQPVWPIFLMVVLCAWVGSDWGQRGALVGMFVGAAIGFLADIASSLRRIGGTYRGK